MQILVIDREDLATQLISSRLEARGHKVTACPGKQQAFDLIRDGGYDCVMVDPAPLSEARPVIVGIWKNIRSDIKPYVVLLSKSATPEDAVLAGANSLLAKPLSNQALEETVGNASRLISLCHRLSGGEPFESKLGIIGKNAFNQLFLSAIDRAFRYGEQSFVVFLQITNFDAIKQKIGAEKSAELDDRLLDKLTFMRRQSDVIGRIGEHDFAILLQRPQYETEPRDALDRFCEVLGKFCRELEVHQQPKITLQLIQLPQGSLHGDRSLPETEENTITEEETATK